MNNRIVDQPVTEAAEDGRALPLLGRGFVPICGEGGGAEAGVGEVGGGRLESSPGQLSFLAGRAGFY